jgi:hypothetical protein
MVQYIRRTQPQFHMFHVSGHVSNVHGARLLLCWLPASIPRGGLAFGCKRALRPACLVGALATLAASLDCRLRTNSGPTPLVASELLPNASGPASPPHYLRCEQWIQLRSSWRRLSRNRRRHYCCL